MPGFFLGMLFGAGFAPIFGVLLWALITAMIMHWLPRAFGLSIQTGYLVLGTLIGLCFMQRIIGDMVRNSRGLAALGSTQQYDHAMRKTIVMCLFLWLAYGIDHMSTSAVQAMRHHSHVEIVSKPPAPPTP